MYVFNVYFICLLNKIIVSEFDNVSFIGKSDKGSFISTDVRRYVYMYVYLYNTSISELTLRIYF